MLHNCFILKFWLFRPEYCLYIVFRTFWWQISILWKMIYLKKGRIKMFWSVKAGLQWQINTKNIGWKSKFIHYKGLSWATDCHVMGYSISNKNLRTNIARTYLVFTNPITIPRMFPHRPMEQIWIDRSTPSYRPIGIKIGP